MAVPLLSRNLGDSLFCALIQIHNTALLNSNTLEILSKYIEAYYLNNAINLIENCKDKMKDIGINTTDISLGIIYINPKSINYQIHGNIGFSIPNRAIKTRNKRNELIQNSFNYTKEEDLNIILSSNGILNDYHKDNEIKTIYTANQI